MSAGSNMLNPDLKQAHHSSVCISIRNSAPEEQLLMQGWGLRYLVSEMLGKGRTGLAFILP